MDGMYYGSIDLDIQLFIYLFIHPFILASIYLFIYPSIHPFTHLLIHPCIYVCRSSIVSLTTKHSNTSGYSYQMGQQWCGTCCTVSTLIYIHLYIFIIIITTIIIYIMILLLDDKLQNTVGKQWF
jgi:hypothetical protein